MIHALVEAAKSIKIVAAKTHKGSVNVIIELEQYKTQLNDIKKAVIELSESL